MVILIAHSSAKIAVVEHDDRFPGAEVSHAYDSIKNPSAVSSSISVAARREMREHCSGAQYWQSSNTPLRLAKQILFPCPLCDRPDKRFKSSIVVVKAEDVPSNESPFPRVPRTTIEDKEVFSASAVWRTEKCFSSERAGSKAEIKSLQSALKWASRCSNCLLVIS
jgi:hypothetical protein